MSVLPSLPVQARPQFETKTLMRSSMSSDDVSRADMHHLRNGYVFELIDTGTPQPLQTIVLVLNPTKYTLSEPHQSTLTPGAAGDVVDESIGVVMRDLNIEGTFGEMSRVAASGTTLNSKEAKTGGLRTGDEHFYQLRQLFRDYSLAKADPSRAYRTKLVFHSLKDDDHYVLSQPVFETPRDNKTARTHYIYRIKAKAIGKAEDVQRMETIPSDEFAFGDGIKTITEAYNDARAGFLVVNQQLSTIRRKVANIQAVMNSVAGFVNSVGQAIRSAGDLTIAYPFRTVASLANTVGDTADDLADAILAGTVGASQDALQSLRDIENAIDRIGMFPEHFQQGSGSEISARYLGPRAITRQDVEDGTGGANAGTRTAAALGTLNEYGLTIPASNSVESVRIPAGASLEQIAANYGTSTMAIIMQNDLRPPYITPTGIPGTLKPGDILLVPVQSNTASPIARGTMDYSDPEAAVFGVGFALDQTALANGQLEIAVDEAHGAMDVALSEGLSSLIDDLSVTLHTERGTTAYIPEVGISRTVGHRGTQAAMILAASRLRDGIVQDSRIIGILSSRVILQGDTLTQEIVPQTVSRSGGLPLAIPIGTARG